MRKKDEDKTRDKLFALAKTRRASRWFSAFKKKHDTKQAARFGGRFVLRTDEEHRFTVWWGFLKSTFLQPASVCVFTSVLLNPIAQGCEGVRSFTAGSFSAVKSRSDSVARSSPAGRMIKKRRPDGCSILYIGCFINDSAKSNNDTVCFNDYITSSINNLVKSVNDIRSFNDDIVSIITHMVNSMDNITGFNDYMAGIINVDGSFIEKQREFF